MMLRVLLALVSAQFTVVAQGNEPGLKPEEIPLPKDRTAVVLTLDYQGGFTPQRKTEAAFMSVHADGTIVVRDLYGFSDREETRGRLSGTELQALLRFVVKQHRLGDWNEKNVARAIAARRKAGKPVPSIIDAADTVVTVALPDTKVEARYNALAFVRRHLADSSDIQRLWAVRSHLDHRAAVLVAGGAKAVDALLPTLNAALKKKHPKDLPFERGDLALTTRDRSGNVRLTFRRELENESTLGTVHVKPDDEVTVDVTKALSIF